MLDALIVGPDPLTGISLAVMGAVTGGATQEGFSQMTKSNDGMAIAEKTAAERIEEARRLQKEIGDTLNAVLDLVKQGDFQDITLLPRQMSRLTDAIADVRKKEAEFNDRFRTGLAEGEIDFDQIRREIGCRLGRIRRCCKQEGVSEKP